MIVVARTSRSVNITWGRGGHRFGFGCLDFAAFALNVDHSCFAGDGVEQGVCHFL